MNVAAWTIFRRNPLVQYVWYLEMDGMDAVKEGALVTAEPREDGLLIRPAIVVPVERCTPERKAEFLLSTATTPKEFATFIESKLNSQKLHTSKM